MTIFLAVSPVVLVIVGWFVATLCYVVIIQSRVIQQNKYNTNESQILFSYNIRINYEPQANEKKLKKKLYTSLTQFETNLSRAKRTIFV